MAQKKTNSYPADRALSYFKIERRARAVRTQLGYSQTQALPSVELFERMQDFTTLVGQDRIPVTWEVEHLARGVEGQTRYDADENEFVIALTPEMYAALESDLPRARFCVAHEIGHVTLHGEELVRMTEIPQHQIALLRGEAKEIETYADTEWQAEAFGAALLMPAAALDEMERTGTLSHRLVRVTFKVSDPAARARLRVWNRWRSKLKEVW